MADDEEGAPISDEEMRTETVVSADEASSGDESDGEDLYEVEQIVGMKKNAEGIMLYRVRWKGYSKAFDTWEPIENLESCLDMVEEYEETKNREKKKRSEERKKRMAIMAGRQIYQEGTLTGPSALPNESTQEPVQVVMNLPSPISSPSAHEGGTLKDTFWKDLEEGRINLFNTDMYSKVKGQGRASRPRSFKKLFDCRKADAEKSGDSGKGADGVIDVNKKTSRSNVKGKQIIKQPKDSTKRRTKSNLGSKRSSKGRSRTHKLAEKDQGYVMSPTTSYSSEMSTDSSDIIMAQVISVSTPSPPILSCVEDYSDDSSRDLSDNRYSSPADITGSLSESASCSQESLSEDTGVCLELSQLSSSLSADKLQTMEIASAVAKSISEEILQSEPNVDYKSENTKKNVTNEKDTIACYGDKPKSNLIVKKQISESKSAKKTKLTCDTHEIHKIVEKKVKLDIEFIYQKQHPKSVSSKKDSVSPVPVKAAVSTGVRPGKENLGDKQLTNIVSGLTSVLSPVTKARIPMVTPRYEARGESGQVAGQKRKEATSPAEFSQPLDKILSSSSLLPMLPENKTTADKGIDLAFDIDLEDIDLDELEKQLTLSPSAQPLELSDEELKHAVLDGDYELVKRAFAAQKVYDMEQEDESGTTLLMHAILRNFDDIAEVLVCNGAKINAQQKSGNTALMIAADQAHICSVALLIEMGAKVNMQQSSGETALMKAVKRGHKQIIRYLLESGANFSYLTYSGYSALSYAKLLRLTDIEDIIVEHVSRLTVEFDRQVAITLNNTAQIISALFPLQCFPLAESDKFVITFKNEMEPMSPGVGFLLFIAHARVTSQEIKCRFYGPCAVNSVVLNGVKQPSLTEEANFVLSCHPVLSGKNELCIHTEPAVSSKAKLVVCAYKAQLIQ